MKVKRKPAATTPPQPPSQDWVGLELTSKGESERNVNNIVELLKKTLKGCELFIPIYYETEEFFEKNVYLLHGYFFIRYNPSHDYYKLKDLKYFEGVCTDRVTGKVQLIPDAQINALKTQFQDLLAKSSVIRKGNTVKILDGLYKNLNGVVQKVNKKDKECIIKITSLKSRNIVVSAPLMGVAVTDDGESGSVVTF